MNFLDKTLATLPNQPASRSTILDELWNSPALTTRPNAGNAYISHVFNDLCRRACTGAHQVSNFTYKELLDISRKLLVSGSTQTSVFAGQASISPEEERLAKLAASILLPLNIDGVGGTRPGKSVTWSPNQSVKELFDTSIAPSITSVPVVGNAVSMTAQISTKFNARNFQQIAGFDVVWTSTLTEHLKVIEIDDTIKVHLFHQTWFLERHLELQDPIISRDLILETFETLALLIPKRDASVRRWFDKLQTKHNLDPGAGSQDHIPLEYRTLDHFHCWRNRLRIILELYDSQEPTSWSQVWRDKRKPVQWWTFWIAVLVLVLTIVFGLIQSITGILQVRNH